MGISITDLQKLCAAGAIRWTGHVLKRLLQRGISQASVVQAVLSGEIIEQYPDDYPFPSCLLLGNTATGTALHVVCGQGPDEVWMITAYCPDSAEWEDDLKTRKKVSQ